MGGFEVDPQEPEPDIDDLVNRLHDVNAPEHTATETQEKEQAKRRHPSVDGLPKAEQPPDIDKTAQV